MGYIRKEHTTKHIRGLLDGGSHAGFACTASEDVAFICYNWAAATSIADKTEEDSCAQRLRAQQGNRRGWWGSFDLMDLHER